MITKEIRNNLLRVYPRYIKVTILVNQENLMHSIPDPSVRKLI